MEFELKSLLHLSQSETHGNKLINKDLHASKEKCFSTSQDVDY